MVINYLQNNLFFRRIIYKAGRVRAKGMVNKIMPYLDQNSTILDIGSGTCNVCQILSENKYRVTPLDIQDLSFVDGIKPIIYDGNEIPFTDNKFDIALISTVLHHTEKPENILNEAKRVSKQIIVIEDIYSNWINKYLTYFIDSLMNLEFTGHPRSNKTDIEWKEIFRKLGLKLVGTAYSHSLIFVKHATYNLKK